MVATDGSTSKWPTEDQAFVRAATELLKAGEYERLAELLNSARAACDQDRDAIPAQTLDLARRICLACGQSQAEAQWHQQAREEAAQREDQLRGQLDALLHLDGDEEWSPAEPVPSAREGPPSLWHRIQGMLRRQPETQPAAAATAAEMPPTPEEVPAPTPPEPEPAAVSPVEPVVQEEAASPSLVVYCLGQFRVYQDDKPVDDWPSSKGKAIFKYLVSHRERPVVKEVLMELFWPGAHPEAARNNLNVAIYGLRQALRRGRPSFSHILFQDDCYLLNPGLQIWTDAEEFAKHCKSAHELEQGGEHAAAVREYHVAEALYDGDLLEEDRYEEWVLPKRTRYQDEYLKLLDCLSRCYFDNGDYAACVTMCRKMLTVDPCREEAHRRLMRCFCRQGQAYLALRQYHLCLERLRRELEVTPAPSTVELYERIRDRQRI